MKSRARRTDDNHQGIVEALRKVGWLVIDASHVGNGFPDLVCAKHGRLELVEVKDGAKSASRRTLTPQEYELHFRLALKGVRVRIVESIADAVQL